MFCSNYFIPPSQYSRKALWSLRLVPSTDPLYLPVDPSSSWSEQWLTIAQNFPALENCPQPKGSFFSSRFCLLHGLSQICKMLTLLPQGEADSVVQFTIQSVQLDQAGDRTPSKPTSHLTASPPLSAALTLPLLKTSLRESHAWDCFSWALLLGSPEF